MIQCKQCGLWFQSGACPGCGTPEPPKVAGWPGAQQQWPGAQPSRGELPGQAPTFVAAIVVATTCCVPAGALGAVWADQAKTMWARGEEEEAKKKLFHAQLALGGGLVGAVLIGILYVALEVARVIK